MSAAASAVCAQDATQAHAADVWAERTRSGMAASAAGRHSEALTLLRAALLTAEQFGEDDPRLATAKSNLALQRLAQGDLEGSWPLLQDALESRRRVLGGEHGRVAESLINIAVWHEANGDLQASELALSQALTIRETLFGPADPASLAVLDRLMDLAVNGDRFGEAIRVGRRLLAADAADDVEASIARHLDLANLLHQHGQLDEAESVLRTGLELLDDVRLRVELAQVLAAQGKADLAIEILRQEPIEILVRAELLALRDVAAATSLLDAFEQRSNLPEELGYRWALAQTKVSKLAGDLDRSLDFANALIESLAAGEGEQSYLLSDAFFLRASIYRARQELQPSITDLLTTLRLERTRHGSMVPALLPTMLALAEVLEADGQFQEAQAMRDEIAGLRQ